MAVEIKLSVQDQYINRVLEALTELAGKPLKVAVNGSGFHGKHSFEFAPKDDAETNKEFAVRVIRENIKAMVKLYEYTIDKARFDSEVSAVTQPSQDVPDNLIE